MTKKIIDMFDEEWERQAIEAEIECGGIIAGRLGSPDDHPPVGPVEEDEETLRQFLRDKLQEMLDKEAARKAQYAFLDTLPPTPGGVDLSKCW